MSPNLTEEEQNQRLADYTNALLDGEAWQEDEPPPLADTVELLARTLGSQRVPDTLQSRLKGMIREGWAQPRYPVRERSPRSRRLAPFWAPARRWVWGAVGALLVLAVVAALAPPTGQESVVGTITGDTRPVLLAIVVVLAAVLGLACAIGRGKR